MKLGIKDSLNEIFEQLRGTPTLFLGTDDVKLLAAFLNGVLTVQSEEQAVDNKAQLYDFGRWLAAKYDRPSGWAWWRTIEKEAYWLGTSECALTWKLWDEFIASL